MSDSIEILERIKQQPEGYPAIGDTFEYEYPFSYSKGASTVFTYLVTGWERWMHDGKEKISVRCWPIHSRDRRIAEFRTCDMGHMHPVLGGEPANPGAPKVWGSCGAEDDPRLVGLDYDSEAEVPTIFPYTPSTTNLIRNG